MVLDAMEASEAYRTASLDAPVRGASEQLPTAVAATLGGEDAEYERVDAAATVARLLQVLPERERKIVELRFYDNLTQAEIAERLGISQMHVSRLLRRALSLLGTRFEAAQAAS